LFQSDAWRFVADNKWAIFVTIGLAYWLIEKLFGPSQNVSKKEFPSSQITEDDESLEAPEFEDSIYRMENYLSILEAKISSLQIPEELTEGEYRELANLKAASKELKQATKSWGKISENFDGVTASRLRAIKKRTKSIQIRVDLMLANVFSDADSSRSPTTTTEPYYASTSCGSCGGPVSSNYICVNRCNGVEGKSNH
jgi:hypothetical protein